MEPVRISLVPHTHWDREWYVPFAVFSERLVEMMDTLLDLADRGFPHFHLDGQTAMIDDYLDRRPERADDVARHVIEGRLSAGPWFTQMDEFLTSGESHIRNLERGLARARELGRALEIGYMPDQFGHIGQMPQLLLQGGIERAVVWRGVPEVIDKDAFWWESPDGSRILTEYMAFGYSNTEYMAFRYSNAETGEGTFDEVAQPERLAEAMQRTADRHRPFMASDRMLVMLGYDHAGPDGTFSERLEAARPHLRSLHVSIGGLAEHLGDQRLSGELPTWKGELRSGARAHLLPNVYSARANQKRERGRVEALIERYAEPLAALVPGVGWPEAELDRAWQLLLWNGAHDSACGCSHDQVALDVDARFAEARTIAEGIVQRAMTELGRRAADPGVIRFNPSTFERDGVPGLGWRVYPAGREPDSARVRLGTGSDGELLADDVRLRLLDEPDVGDLYNFCWAQAGQVPSPPAEIRIDGQTATARFDERLEVRLRVTRRRDEPFLRFEGVVVNGRPDHRLRLHIDLGHATAVSLAGSPFELVERPLIGEGSSLEAPSPTWPARQVVLAGETAAFHEGVFEYEVAGGRELAMTLLRCVGTISRDTMATRPWAAGPDVPTPGAQMIGETTFTIGVWPDAVADGLLANWERFALPIAQVSAGGGGPSPAVGTLLEFAGDAQLSGVRRTRAGIEVRLWNASKDARIRTTVAGRTITLAPARIETVALGTPPAAG